MVIIRIQSLLMYRVGTERQVREAECFPISSNLCIPRRIGYRISKYSYAKVIHTMYLLRSTIIF